MFAGGLSAWFLRDGADQYTRKCRCVPSLLCSLLPPPFSIFCYPPLPFLVNPFSLRFAWEQGNRGVRTADVTTTKENVSATPALLRLRRLWPRPPCHVGVVTPPKHHNRVLIWNRIPTSNNQPATWLWGSEFNQYIVPGNRRMHKSMRGRKAGGNPEGKL